MTKPWNLVVIDDDEVDIEHLRRAVQRAGDRYQLWIARDGVEGLALLRSGTIPRERQAVLLDLNMPRMNGLDCLRVIRSDPTLCHTNIVVLSTSNDDQDLSAAKALGVRGYLLKPISFVALAELLT